MKKVLLLVMFTCLAFLLGFGLDGISSPAYATNFLKIENFYGSVSVYAYNMIDEVIHDYFLQNPINIDDQNQFNDVGKIVFYPQEGKAYEYLLDDKTDFLPLSYGQTLSNIDSLWVREVQKFNAVFVSDCGSETLKVYKRDCVVPPDPPSCNGEVFLGWQAEGQSEIFEFSTPIEQNMVFEPVFRQVPSLYHIVFVIEDANNVEFFVNEGLFLEQLPIVQEEGKVFSGWKEEGQECTFVFLDTPIDRDYVFYPVFDLLVILHTLTFTVNEQTYATRDVVDGTIFCDFPQDPTKELYLFVGWQAVGCEDFDLESSPIIADMEFLPIYNKIASVVTFVTDNEIFLSTVTVGERVTARQIPEKTGHNALWHCNGAPYDFDEAVYYEITLTAVYTRIVCRVYFELGEGSPIGDPCLVSVQVLYGEDALPPQVSPPIGYRFAVWDGEYTCITSDRTLCAVYTEIICDIAFYYVNEVQYSVSVDYGTVLHEPSFIGLEAELPEGRYLEGWTLSEDSQDKYNFEEPITSSLTFYAVIKRYAYKINYFDGARAITDETYQTEVLHGDTLILPEGPAKAHAEFECWSLSPASFLPYNEMEEVMAELTLYARYRAVKFTVSTEVSAGISLVLTTEFADSGELITFSYSLPEGYILAEKALLTPDGAVSLDEDSFVMPASNVTLKILLCQQKYTVDVIVSGDFVAAVCYGEDYSPECLATPAHYKLENWYTDEALTVPYCGQIKAAYGEAVTIYPKFVKEKYLITFLHGYGGTIEDTQNVVYGDMPIPPSVLEDEYLVFTSWNKSIEAAVNDTVYTAKYKLIFDNYYYDNTTLLICVKGDLCELPQDYQVPEKTDFIYEGFVTESIDLEAHTASYMAIYTAKPPKTNNENDPIAEPPLTPSQDNTTDVSPQIAVIDTQRVVLTSEKLKLLLGCLYAFVLARVVISYISFLAKRKNPLGIS